MKNVVAMAAIPGGVRRGATVRMDLRYSVYAIATWKWWCRRRNIEFVLIDRPELADPDLQDIPPTFQRWISLARLIAKSGPDTRVAMVDADTMIRWDAPDLFEISGPDLSAVRDTGANWVYQSIRAYQSLFPGVSLPWWEYFNSGVVILGSRQLYLLEAFINLTRERWPELRVIQTSGDHGTDQPVLNFVVRQTKQPVNFLPPPFNFLHCFPMDQELKRIDWDQNPDFIAFASKAFSRRHAFDFVDMAYVWHFTSVVASRHLVMRETWRRVCERYPGADIDPEAEPMAGHATV